MNERYSRQEILKEIGATGQEKIEKSSIAIVGVGALGTAAAELLTRAGIGTLILIDRDVVEISNLQRQCLFTEEDVGRSKAVVAAEKIEKINSGVRTIPKAIHLSRENIDVLAEADLILDCTDNLQTRYLINQYSRKEKKPWIYSAALRTEGYVMPILPKGPCLRCFISTAPVETCATSGVLNTITTIIAAHQTTIALKIIIKGTDSVNGEELLKINAWEHTLRKIKIKKRNDCPACYDEPDQQFHEKNAKTIRFCSTGKYQVEGKKKDLYKVKEQWQKAGPVEDDGETISFQNILLFKDGRALIKANSEEEARASYDQWIGD